MKTTCLGRKTGKSFALWSITLLSLATLFAAAERWEARAPGPPKRTGQANIWTGKEFIVWGGGRQSTWLNDGARYDPATDTWSTVSSTNAPSGRWYHSAVWTGKEMIVWGGRANYHYTANNFNDGARYDPETDTWTPMSTNGSPARRSQFAYVWTGTEFIVWGGFTEGGAPLGDGARYNPETDTWTPLPMSNAPNARVSPVAVWTGEEMIVWGGLTVGSPWVSFSTGARYNPSTDTWTPLPTEGAPRGAAMTEAVWTGTDMIVWSGEEFPSQEYINGGARYNLADNVWIPISSSNAPSPRVYASAVWTGSELIIYGGSIGSVMLGDGARYNVTNDTWTPITSTDAPHVRMFIPPHTAVWTGEGMLMYGGSYWPYELNDTAYYLPYAPPPPPVPPTITLQPTDQTVLEGSPVSFAVSARGTAPLAYQWQFNGADVAGATNTTLRLASVWRTDEGDYTVIVSNPAGSVTSQVARLTVTMARVLELGSVPAQQEGTTLEVPLNLISEGDVGGMTFIITYDPTFLAALRLDWDRVVRDSFASVNTNTPGQIRATFALPATAVPAGTQTVAQIKFFLRSVPQSLTTTPGVQIVDVSDPSGETLTGNIGRCAAPIGVQIRSIICDNNANDRLDVGDATVLLRYLAGLAEVRGWDVMLNDINANQRLDSGDTIKVLRVAAEIDPQPEPQTFEPQQEQEQVAVPGGAVKEMVETPEKVSVTPNAVLMPASLRASPGEGLTIQVRLQNMSTPVSGAAFTVNYNPAALRLVSAQSCRTGSLVPANALGVWNVAPAQNNFGLQNGHVSLAVSHADPWPATEGVLAELTFQVQDGATAQYLWPVTLTGVETTEDGYQNHQLAAAGMNFIGRDPVGGKLSLAAPVGGGPLSLTLSGDAGVTYVVEASADLVHWTVLNTVVNVTGTITVADPDAGNFPCRFYRTRVAQ